MKLAIAILLLINVMFAGPANYTIHLDDKSLDVKSIYLDSDFVYYSYDKSISAFKMSVGMQPSKLPFVSVDSIIVRKPFVNTVDRWNDKIIYKNVPIPQEDDGISGLLANIIKAENFLVGGSLILPGKSGVNPIFSFYASMPRKTIYNYYPQQISEFKDEVEDYKIYAAGVTFPVEFLNIYIMGGPAWKYTRREIIRDDNLEFVDIKRTFEFTGSAGIIYKYENILLSAGGNLVPAGIIIGLGINL